MQKGEIIFILDSSNILSTLTYNIFPAKKQEKGRDIQIKWIKKYHQEESVD